MLRAFSEIWVAVFLLGLILSPEAQAWNPDYGYDLPKQRRMCVVHSEDRSSFYAISPSEDCEAPAQRYIVVFSREPQGAMALLPAKTSNAFYPPLVVRWPTEQNPNRVGLWHFTCVAEREQQLLDSSLTLYEYKGELTTNGNQDCSEAAERLLQYCQDGLQGDKLLESCPLSWGVR